MRFVALSSILFLLAPATSLLADPVGPSKETPKNLRKVGDPEIPDISGYYTCKGQEAGGKKYSGVCVLTKKGDVYVISWVIGSGSSFTGIAIRQGNTLAGSWAIPTDKGVVKGVNLYRIDSGANGPLLKGYWSSIPGPGVQQQETLTFLKKLDTEED